MIALARKEWRQLQPFTYLVTVVLTVIWYVISNDDFPLAPSQELQFFWWLVYVLFGTVLGYYQLGVERSGETWSLLLHRSLGRRRVFAVKVLVGWGALACICIAPVLIAGALSELGVFERTNLRGRRLVELVALACAAFAAHGLGALATTWKLPAQLRGGAALLGAFGLALWGAIVTIADWGGFWDRILGLAGGYVALGAAAAALACANARDGSDRDRVLPGARAVASALFAFAFLALPVLAVVSIAQRAFRSASYAEYPAIVWDWNEGAFRTDDGTPSNHVWYPNVTGSRAWWDEAPPLEWPRSFHAGDTWHRLGSFSSTGNVIGYCNVWFERAGGTVRVACSGLMDVVDGVGFREGARFSRDTVPVALGLGRGRARRASGPPGCLLDPRDSTLWVVHAEGEVEPLELPGGDRFVSLDVLPRHLNTRTGLSGPDVTIRGERGRYRWTGTGLEPVAAEDVVDNGVDNGIATRDLRPHDVEVRGGHTATPTVTIRDRETREPLFVHTYRPRRARPRLAHLALQALVLLRPPAVVVGSHLRDGVADGNDASLLTEQEVFGGRRLDLVALNVLLAAGIAWRVGRELARSGARPVERAIWIALALGLGPALYPVFRLVRPRGTRVSFESSPPRAPLLSEAATERPALIETV